MPLRRVVGRADLTAQAVNIMMGSAVFVLPGVTANELGAWAPFAVLAAVCGTGLILLSFAEAAGHYREAGGPYRYVGDAFGEYLGTQTALLYWFVRATASAAVANVFVTYLTEVWPAASEPAWRFVVLTTLIALSGAINVWGTRHTASALNLFTMAKVVPLLCVAVFGIAIVGIHLPAMPAPSSSTFARIVLLWVFALGGFEASLIPAGEARNPARDGPRALLYALTIIAIVYILTQLTVTGTVAGLASDRPVSEAANILIGPVGAQMVAAAVLVSTSSAIPGSIFAASRLTFAIAERRGLPAILARVHPTLRTPYVSITLFAVLVWALAISGSFTWNASISAVARLIVYGATSLSVLAIGRRRRSAFRIHPLVHVSSIVFCLWLLGHQTWAEARAVATIWIGASVTCALYRWRFGRGSPNSRVTHIHG